MRQQETEIEQRESRWYCTTRRRRNGRIAACGFGKSEQHALIAIEAANDSRYEDPLDARPGVQ